MEILSYESKYEPFYSFERLRLLQNLCSPLIEPGKYQSILLIGGADGNHLNFSQAILKYLFLGSTGQDLLGTQVINDKLQILDETILLIEYSQISIFYATDARPYLLPYISIWHNVREYCISIPKEDTGNTITGNDWEERKIECFAQMISHVHSCGIPLQLEKHQTAQMAAEMIPLIQAYGIDQPHVQRGFFTMKYVVLDNSNDLHKILSFDMYAAKRLTSYAEPLLRDHFYRFLLSIDLMNPAERSNKTELELAETLFMYYEFGSLNFPGKNIFLTDKQGPRCLFGVHTSDDLDKSLSTATIKNQGCSTIFPATHLLIQAEDPATSLRAIRTYFFGCGKVAMNVSELDTTIPRSDPKLEQYKKLPSNAADLCFLSSLYRLLIKVSDQAVEQLPLWLTDAKDMNSLLKEITNYVKDDIKQNYPVFVTDAMKFWEPQILWHINVDISFLDASGQTMSDGAVASLFNEISSSKQIHKYSHMTISFCINDIPSSSVPTKLLGSVKLGDSFLIRWKKEPFGTATSGNMTTIFTAALATSTLSATVHNVTQGIPYYRTWLQDGKEFDFSSHLTTSIKSDYWANLLQLGHSLDKAMNHVFLITKTSEWPFCQGTLYGYSNGFAFVTPYFPPLVISFTNNVQEMSYAQSEVSGTSICCLTLKKESNPLSSIWTFIPSNLTIGIPLFQQSSSSHKTLLEFVGQWKIAAGIHHVPVLTKDELDNNNDKIAPILNIPTEFVKTCHLITHMHGMVNNGIYTVYKEATRSLFPSLPVPHKHAVFETSWSSRTKVGTKQNPLQLVVYLGIHGSNVSNIARQVQNLSSVDNTWFTLDLNIGATKCQTMYDIYHYLYTQLKQTTETISLSAQSFTKRPRLMLVLQGFFDPILVLLCLKNPLYPYPLELKLTSITTVLNSVHIYQPVLNTDRSAKEAHVDSSNIPSVQNLFPFFMNHCQYPFTDNIILVYSNLLSEKESASLRYRLHQANPVADILCLHNCIFDRSTDSLLLHESNDKIALLATSDVYQLWTEIVVAEDIKSSKYMQLPVTPESISVRFKATGPFTKESIVNVLLKGLMPNATLSSTAGEDPNQEKESLTENMKGLRLAQHLAKEKVIKKSTLSKLQHEGQHVPVKTTGCVWSFSIENLHLKKYQGSYTFLAVDTKAWLYPLDKGASNDGTIFEFTGTKLNKECLQEMLMACRPGAISELTTNAKPNVPKKEEAEGKSLRSRITHEELQELQKKHMTDPLPDDVFFDGRQYVSMSGETYEYHSNMDKFIEEYLKTKKTNNTEIKDEQKNLISVPVSLKTVTDTLVEI